MRHDIWIGLFILFLSAPSALSIQDSARVEKYQAITLKNQFFQVKDQFNYGLVFHGWDMAGMYTFVHKSEKNTFTYEAGLGLGLDLNKGIGITLRAKPVHISYTRALESSGLTLGAYHTSSYQWQVYPDLQSGHMFWLTSMEVGPQFTMIVPLKDKKIQLCISSSLLSLTSRPEPATETYYYTLRFTDFIRNAHRDMQFGWIDRFNHTSLELAWRGFQSERLDCAFACDYYGYFRDPTIRLLFYSFNLKWKIRER